MALKFADAIRLASKDPQFAADLVRNPDDYRSTFNLSDEEIKRLKQAKLEDALSLGSGGGVGPAVY